MGIRQKLNLSSKPQKCLNILCISALIVLALVTCPNISSDYSRSWGAEITGTSTVAITTVNLICIHDYGIWRKGKL